MKTALKLGILFIADGALLFLIALAQKRTESILGVIPAHYPTLGAAISSELIPCLGTLVILAIGYALYYQLFGEKKSKTD